MRIDLHYPVGAVAEANEPVHDTVGVVHHGGLSLAVHGCQLDQRHVWHGVIKCAVVANHQSCSLLHGYPDVPVPDIGEVVLLTDPRRRVKDVGIEL